MANVVEQIRKEHANMARLLSILERQIDTFEDAGTPDYDLIQEIVFYFADFPDTCHHPKEDLLARKLLEADPARAAPLRGLPEMHEELGLLTNRMIALLELILKDAEIPRAKLVQATREYVDSQRHHMEMEELHFLPLAESLLDAQALDPPPEEIFSQQDPLFDKHTERYTKLIEDILIWERESRA